MKRSLLRTAVVSLNLSVGIGTIGTAWSLSPMLHFSPGLLIAAYGGGALTLLLGLAVLWQFKSDESCAPDVPLRRWSRIKTQSAHALTVTVVLPVGLATTSSVPLYVVIQSEMGAALHDMAVAGAMREDIFPPAGVHRDCSVSTAIADSFVPATIAGALMKKTMLLDLAAPDFAADGSMETPACISDTELSARFPQIISIASNEASRVNRIPFNTAQASAKRVVFSELDSCFLSMSRGNATPADMASKCVQPDEADE